MSLLEKLSKAHSIKNSFILDESPLFNQKDVIPTDLPILNIAFSASLHGGLISGLTMIAGESKSFKTLLSLYCLKAYFDKHPDAVCLFYDSEFGVTPTYLRQFDIDPSRIIQIPIEHIEQMKFDIAKRLEAIERDDKVFILVDSIGNVASKKEVEDALNENAAADMTRAKQLKSFFRIVTPHLTMKNIPMVVINHVYASQGMFPTAIVSGGSGGVYSSNQIFRISKSQEKAGTDIVGYNFTINIEKSRFVREKSKFPFTVLYGKGIQKYSGLLDMAMEAKLLAKPKNGWYCECDPETGELSDKNMRLKDLMSNDDVWNKILTNPSFEDYIRSRYSLETEVIVDEPEELDA